LEYPPRVLEALIRLRPVADLRLPFFPETPQDGSTEQIADRQPLDFTESQDDIGGQFSSKNLSAILRKAPYLNHEQSPHFRVSSQVVAGPTRTVSSKRMREETPEPGNRKFKKRVSTPKLRHDDSQIQFATIESSPITSVIVDSLLLTDRQKEVKERQHAEAAMFPDLRSSPRQKSSTAQKREISNTDLPLHRSDSKTSPLISNRPERQTTPVFMPQVDYDEYVNSSPTPTCALQIEEDFPDEWTCFRI